MYTLTMTNEDIWSQPFAEINFRCSGPDLNDADAAMKVLDFGGGCDSSGSTDGRVFILSRLGVLCGLE